MRFSSSSKYRPWRDSNFAMWSPAPTTSSVPPETDSADHDDIEMAVARVILGHDVPTVASEVAMEAEQLARLVSQYRSWGRAALKRDDAEVWRAWRVRTDAPDRVVVHIGDQVSAGSVGGQWWFLRKHDRHSQLRVRARPSALADRIEL